MNALQAVVAAAALALAGAAAHQDQDAGNRLNELLDSAARAFTLDEGAVAGAGGEFLLRESRNAESLLIGESHANEETPRLATAMIRALRSHGYGVLAIETGPLTGDHLEALARGGGVEAIGDLSRRLPFTVPFFNWRVEAEMLADAVERGYDVWGLDQEFAGCGRFFTERLVDLAPDGEARALAESWRAKAVEGFEHFARTRDQSRGFMMVVTPADFDELDRAFADGPDEAKAILRELRASARVYQHYRDGRYYMNNRDRIRLMKRHVAERLQLLGSKADAAKIIYKFGSAHMGRGFSPFDQLDLGNQAAEIAALRGGDSFHVYVFARRSVSGDGSTRDFAEGSPHLQPLYEVMDERLGASEGDGDGDGAVRGIAFDMRTLRPFLSSRRNREAFADLHELARRYDAVVLFPTFHAAKEF